MPASTVDQVDVLIIGAGPAGLMAAEWLAHMGVNVRIVDKRGTKVFNGQADGVAIRTQEIFDSFGIVEQLHKEANRMSQVNTWIPGKDGVLERGARNSMGGWNEYSRYSGIRTLHQGRIERLLIDKIKDVASLKVERGVMPSKLDVDESQLDDPNAFPITIELQHLTAEEATPQQNLTSVPDGLFRSNLSRDDTDDLIRGNAESGGRTEIIKAKYVVGCDGAHSWTRRQLEYNLVGDATDHIWGALDILPKTDFPDARRCCTIHSANDGTILWIPRERGLARIYVQLTEVAPGADGRADRANITPATILAAAKKIMAPYDLSYDYCDWWTAYQIGQRCMGTYSKWDRVFLAGDACHTHSPKAGQGMNVSMQDTFNLGWKLGLVAKGLAKPEILRTYESERNWIGAGLIDVDRKLSRLMSAKPNSSDAQHGEVKAEDMFKIYEQSAMFQSGTGFTYGRSSLVAAAPSDTTGSEPTQPASKAHLATGITVGQRMRSYKVLNHSDYLSWHFAQWFVSDGRFRIILFAGDITDPAQKQRVEAFCARLAAPDSFFSRYNANGHSPRPLIHLMTLHCADKYETDLADFPELLRPFHKHRGQDYNSIFVDDAAISGEPGLGEAYKGYGVDKERGCVVVLRPDQHVGYLGELEDVEDLGAYFDGILLPPAAHRSQLTFQEREDVLGAVSARTGNHADV